MNPTIRNETREMLLNLIGINLNRLSEQSRAEVRHIARMEKDEHNEEEMFETAVGQQHLTSNQNQIVPLDTL